MTAQGIFVQCARCREILGMATDHHGAMTLLRDHRIEKHQQDDLTALARAAGVLTEREQ